MEKPLLNKAGYPSKKTLATIRDWKFSQRHSTIDALMYYIQKSWTYKHRAANPRPGIWTFSTGGWSGNEQILDALYQSEVWYFLQRRSMQLSGGFLCIATNDDAMVELKKLEQIIVKWGWSEKVRKVSID